MDGKRKKSSALRNQLLAKLPTSELEHLVPYLEAEYLAKDQILYEPGDRITQVYFPESGLISLMACTEKRCLEVSAAGAGSIAGVQSIVCNEPVPYRAVVLLPGKAWRISASRFKAEFDRSKHLHATILRHLQLLIIQFTQSLVCYRFHRLEQRLSRWLLVWRREANSNQLPLTQRAIASMLGVSRTLITITAHKLKGAGIIDYQPGSVTVLDVERLAERACECHHIVQEETDLLFGK